MLLKESPQRRAFVLKLMEENVQRGLIDRVVDIEEAVIVELFSGVYHEGVKNILVLDIGYMLYGGAVMENWSGVWLEHLCVVDSKWGKGVGYFLLYNVLNTCISRGVFSFRAGVYVYNFRALHFCLKHGFHFKDFKYSENPSKCYYVLEHPGRL